MEVEYSFCLPLSAFIETGIKLDNRDKTALTFQSFLKSLFETKETASLQFEKPTLRSSGWQNQCRHLTPFLCFYVTGLRG